MQPSSQEKNKTFESYQEINRDEDNVISSDNSEEEEGGIGALPVAGTQFSVSFCAQIES